MTQSNWFWRAFLWLCTLVMAASCFFGTILLTLSYYSMPIQQGGPALLAVIASGVIAAWLKERLNHLPST